MPYRRKKNVKRYRRKQKAGVKSRPKQIQAASYVPSRRMVRFTETRSYVVEDSQGILSSYPPGRSFPCNDPTQAFTLVYKNGTWHETSLGGKPAGVAHVDRWVTDKLGAGGGAYRTASAVSSTIKVNVTPLHRGEGSDAFQDMATVVLQRSTGVGNQFHDKAVSSSQNSEIYKQMPMTKSADIWTNPNGTPRGCCISDSYSFSKMNGLKGTAQNIFASDGMVTTEHDAWCLTIQPGYSARYGNVTDGTKIPDCRVEVQITYVVALSEPSTGFAQLNAGIDLGQAAEFGAAAVDIGQALLFAG